MARRPLDRETLVHRTFLACLVVASLAAPPTHAELNLPERTIVVRNFARKRQDLLDTLQVNLPDMGVEIEEFRGADVVLKVAVKAEVEDQEQAERTLRRHCDRLIRKAFEGMRLAEASSFVFQTDQVGADPGNKDIVSRLKKALATMRGEEAGEEAAEGSAPEAGDAPAEVAAAPEDAPEGAGTAAPSATETKERNGYLESLRNAAEQRYRDLIARAKGEVPGSPAPAAPGAPSAPPAATPPHLAAPGPALAALTSETTEKMARYPAVPRPKPVGSAAREALEKANWKARRDALLEKQETRSKLVRRISDAPNISPETVQAIQSYERGRTSLDTVRGIYAQIFQDRRRGSSQEDAPIEVGAPMITAPAGDELPALAAAPAPAPPAPRPAPAAALPPRTADALLGSKIEALFDSVEASEKGGRPGISMVASSAPAATSTREETP